VVLFECRWTVEACNAPSHVTHMCLGWTKSRFRLDPIKHIKCANLESLRRHQHESIQLLRVNSTKAHQSNYPLDVLDPRALNELQAMHYSIGARSLILTIINEVETTCKKLVLGKYHSAYPISFSLLLSTWTFFFCGFFFKFM
jgi:hypothetical protein